MVQTTSTVNNFLFKNYTVTLSLSIAVKINAKYIIFYWKGEEGRLFQSL